MATGATSGTAPNDLVGLCSVSQEDLTRYVQTVQPCIDGDEGKKACTSGAVYRKSSSHGGQETCRLLTDVRVQGLTEDRMRTARIQ